MSDQLVASSRQPLIGGSTRLFIIVGDPIAQVKSPHVFNPRFAAAGRDAVLLPVNVRPERFEETMRGLMAVANLDGIIATVPYKARMLPLADTVLPTGARVGAVNAMRRDPDGRWTASMFDGSGLMRGLRLEGIEPRGRQVMQIGAGGAGSAVAVAFAEAGAARLTIHDIDSDKAQALAERVGAAFPGFSVNTGTPDLASHDTLVNCSPAGMKAGDGFPVPLDGLRPEMVVVDIIIVPEVTPLLAHARAVGCRALGGKTMLGGQADDLMQFFGIESTP